MVRFIRQCVRVALLQIKFISISNYRKMSGQLAGKMVSRSVRVHVHHSGPNNGSKVEHYTGKSSATKSRRNCQFLLLQLNSAASVAANERMLWSNHLRRIFSYRKWKKKNNFWSRGRRFLIRKSFHNRILIADRFGIRLEINYDRNTRTFRIDW